jgi:hypothetical protein
LAIRAAFPHNTQLTRLTITTQLYYVIHLMCIGPMLICEKRQCANKCTSIFSGYNFYMDHGSLKLLRIVYMSRRLTVGRTANSKGERPQNALIHRHASAKAHTNNRSTAVHPVTAANVATRLSLDLDATHPIHTSALGGVRLLVCVLLPVTQWLAKQSALMSVVCHGQIAWRHVRSASAIC